MISEIIKVMEKTNYPLIADISVVQFRKSDTKIYWKTSFNDSEFNQVSFYKKIPRPMQ